MWATSILFLLLACSLRAEDPKPALTELEAANAEVKQLREYIESLKQFDQRDKMTLYAAYQACMGQAPQMPPPRTALATPSEPSHSVDEQSSKKKP